MIPPNRDDAPGLWTGAGGCYIRVAAEGKGTQPFRPAALCTPSRKTTAAFVVDARIRRYSDSLSRQFSTAQCRGVPNTGMVQVGSRIGRYEVQRRLSRGGMGTLYLAQDPVLDRLVAVKLFLSDLDLEDARERFVREARSAAALNHPNIVTIYDYGEYASQPYIVMEYIQGETLADVIRRHTPMSTTTKLRWMIELCAAVGYAHTAGIIHRDIKPANLMVDAYGRLKVLDFGIARMRGTLASNGTALIGTPGYMAPEQIRGGAIDHRSDLFSIGVVCYELLSYVEAFSGDTMHVITNRILQEDPRRLSEVYPGVEPELDRIVWQALQKDPDHRFQDTESLRNELEVVRRRVEMREPDTMVPSPAAAGSPPPRPGTGGSRRRLHDAPEESAVPAASTPAPPDRRRTDREALARRRAAQVEEALARARACLEAGDFDAARESCEQALTLDESHVDALELFHRIKTAHDFEDARALLEQARGEIARRDLTAAGELLQRARVLDADNPELGPLERDLRIARVEQELHRKRSDAFHRALDAADDALARGDLEDALVHAREALELDPSSEQARALEEEALDRLEEETVRPNAVAPSPAPRTTPNPARQAAVAGPAGLATVVAPVRRSSGTGVPKAKTGAPAKTQPASARERWRIPNLWPASFNDRQRRIANIGSAALLVVGAAVIAWAVASRDVPPGPVRVVIDAVPWAAVTAVQSETGERIQLPEVASTPLALQMTPGKYTVTLVGPPPISDTRVVSVVIEAGRNTVLDMQRFEAMTAEQYFDSFLREPAAAAPPTAATEQAAAPSVVPAVQGQRP